MIRLFSPSKINLFFRILRKREDGYHEVATLLQAISLGDWLTFEESRLQEDRLVTNDPHLPTDSSNLVLKAAQLFRSKSAIPLYIRVNLDKRVPYQAGLGGGSGNAATTLWAMNELAGRPATPLQLAEWAGEIGSDISFFFSQGIAYCTGRGEKVSPCALWRGKHQQAGWIAKPTASLSTPMVYRYVNAATLPRRDPQLALQRFTQGEKEMFNDLEPAAFQAIPALAELKQRLLKGGFTEVLLAGSGSAFVCLGSAGKMDLPDVKWYPFHFVAREEGAWYQNEKDS